MLLAESTVKQYLSVLASEQPAPGGGSVAALLGCLGASLTEMVVNLSFGKKSYENLDQDKKDRMLKEFEKVKKIHEKLLVLVDEDKRVFEIYMAAMKLPKETEEDKIIRSKSMDAAIINCLKVPLQVAEESFLLLKNQEYISLYGNKGAISDVGIGAICAMSALESAILNIKINLPYIKDEQLKNDTIDRIHVFETEAKPMEQETLRIVNERLI